MYILVILHMENAEITLTLQTSETPTQLNNARTNYSCKLYTTPFNLHCVVLSMTENNAKMILFASLITAMILPFSGMSAAQAADAVDDESLIAQYDRIFSSDNNLSDQKKIQVITSMQNGVEIQLSTPQDQDKVAYEVLEILEQIDNSKSVDERMKLQEKLDGKTEIMLQVGLVLATEYEKDPDKWDKELDRTANSKQRTKIVEERDSKVGPATYGGDSIDIIFVSTDPLKASTLWHDLFLDR